MKCYCYGECLGIAVLLNGVCLAFGESEKKKKVSFFEHKAKKTNQHRIMKLVFEKIRYQMILYVCRLSSY